MAVFNIGRRFESARPCLGFDFFGSAAKRSGQVQSPAIEECRKDVRARGSPSVRRLGEFVLVGDVQGISRKQKLRRARGGSPENGDGRFLGDENRLWR